MHIKRYKQASANLFAENKILKFGFVILLIIVVYNWQAMNTAADSKRTVLIPLGSASDVWVSNNDASDNYLRLMARYISAMVGNYTASSARRQFEELLSLYTPEVYAKAKTSFESQADNIERFPTISSRIMWQGDNSLKINEERRIMTITMLKDRLVSGSITRSTKVELAITFDINYGRFEIEAINLKEKER